MIEGLKKLMEKKKGKELDPAYKNAKLGVLDQIKGLAEDHMKGDIAGLKKVSVMAPDEESLKEGLETAKEVVSEMPSKEEEKEMCSECGKEPCECESSEMDKLSPEEQEMLAKLLKKMKE